MTTIRTTTIARNLVVFVAIELVVEGQFFSGKDVADGEDPHRADSTGSPLLDLAVGVAAVVDEARGVSFVRSVDQLIWVETHVVHVQLAFAILLLMGLRYAPLRAGVRFPSVRSPRPHIR